MRTVPTLKKILMILAFVLVITLQAFWFVLPRRGSSMGDSYRNKNRIAALKEYAEHPSDATRQNMDKELSLLSEHVAHRQRILLTAFLIADVGVVWFAWRLRNSWNRRHKKVII